MDYIPAFNLSHNLIREIVALRPKGKTFIHYTSLEAFYSIIESGRIRFTSAKSTNDPSEFLFGKSIVEKALHDIRDIKNASECKIIDQILAGIQSLDFRAFVFCMSETIDDETDVGDLNQWRLYGADGRGIALVFDINWIESENQLTRLTSIPRLVQYGENDGIALVKQEVRAFLDGLADLPTETKEFLRISPSSKSGYLRNCIFWLPSVIKHRAYRHEREVRLIRGDIGEWVGNPLIFIEKGSIRRPAIEIPICEMQGTYPNNHNSSPIKKLIIGPSGDQSAIEDSIRFFLESKKWSLQVVRSDIPYRAV